jgi:hypothetical protein
VIVEASGNPDVSTSVLQRALTSKIHDRSRVMQSKAAETRNNARRREMSKRFPKRREKTRDGQESNGHRMPRERALATRSSLHVSRFFFLLGVSGFRCIISDLLLL